MATPPIPWSISALVAFVTAPQLSVVDCPAVIVAGFAVNVPITGAPGHAGGGGGAVGAVVGGGVTRVGTGDGGTFVGGFVGAVG